MRPVKWMIVVLVSLAGVSYGTENDTRYSMIGSAYLDNQSYGVLERICDEAGGRPAGSEQNEKAISILKAELESIGFRVNLEKFQMPGWVRGNDVVQIKEPVNLKLQAAALGYVDRVPVFESRVVYAGYGSEETFRNLTVKNRIVLVSSEKPPLGKELMRSEIIELAGKYGAKAVLFINRKPGGLNLAGTGNFQGTPTAVPAYSLTFEEGKRLARLLEKNIPVTIRIDTRSFCKEIETSNLTVTIPGKVKDKIVVGAHLDSWDLSQGGIDNGLGTAILFDVARILKKYSPDNYYTIEFVWFNGEELGLWGAKNYAGIHHDDPVVAMINMDMTGTPTGFNAMGFDYLLPFLQSLKDKLNGFELKNGVISRPWTNSDHMPFLLKGIPVIGLQAHLDESMVKYYHSHGDSFDKVNKKYLSDAAAVVSILVKELANDSEIPLKRLTDTETANMLIKFDLYDRLERQGEWIY
ncbi:MAG: M28 family peptidase [Calditrichaceae bacterium]